MTAKKLTENEWGFSVADDNPFAIFTYLQKIAKDSVGENDVIDLSRGDPGYGFTPSVKGRRFFSYLILLDSWLNHEGRRFNEYDDTQYNEIYEDIVSFTKDSYSDVAARELIIDLKYFVEEIVTMADGCGLKWSKFDVFKRVFSFCPVSGGSYLNPQGEEIVRVVLADWYKKFIETQISPADLIVFQGASHAIGTIFKALGKGGIDYLTNIAVISSPAYAPYNSSLLNRSVNTFGLSVDPFTGKISQDNLDHLENLEDKVDVIIMIDPNNPTGFSFDENTLSRIASIADKHDCIIVSDEVYSSFFPKKKTIVDFAPKRTLRIDARSKIERSTGLRFGDLLITEEANKYISENILKNKLIPGQDLKSYLIQAKGPGGVEGELQHTTFVPGPAQFLGICHMIMGGEERKNYFKSVRNNSEIFVKELGLPHKDNLYYVIFNLDEIEGSNKKEDPIEKKLLNLAKLGIVYLPVHLFFSEFERVEKGSLNMVRASVVNTNAANVIKAAKITKEYLTK